MDVVQDCGLCTWHTPAQADGKPWIEYQQEHSAVGGGVFRSFEHGNESWSELVVRTGRTFEQIAAHHKQQTMLVVTHAETIASSFIVFGGLPLAPGFDMKAANASIAEWTMDGDPDACPCARWTLVRFNDHAHVMPAVD